MANEEQLSILKQGVDVWNKWRSKNGDVQIDLSKANLSGADLSYAYPDKGYLKSADIFSINFNGANLRETNLSGTDLIGANLKGADLRYAHLRGADLRLANLIGADLTEAYLAGASLSEAVFIEANLSRTHLNGTDLRNATFQGCNLSKARVGDTIFGNSDLSEAVGLDDVEHDGPSSISTDTFNLSKGKISEVFLRGCGLSDWEIEQVKLYNPDLSNDEITQIQYKIYELRATQALQISPLFISYSHGDSTFVDRLESHLNKKGIRFWRDIHDMKAGRIEKQIDTAISQNRTVLLILSEHSIKSDWVEHEVRMARGLEKEIGRDVLCPVALDDSWKSSPWPKRVMEQIMEYNILDFSAWKDDVKFEGMFRKLIDGLELFYKDKSHGE